MTSDNEYKMKYKKQNKTRNVLFYCFDYEENKKFVKKNINKNIYS